MPWNRINPRISFSSFSFSVSFKFVYRLKFLNVPIRTTGVPGFYFFLPWSLEFQVEPIERIIEVECASTRSILPSAAAAQQLIRFHVCTVPKLLNCYLGENVGRVNFFFRILQTVLRIYIYISKYHPIDFATFVVVSSAKTSSRFFLLFKLAAFFLVLKKVVWWRWAPTQTRKWNIIWWLYNAEDFDDLLKRVLTTCIVHWSRKGISGVWLSRHTQYVIFLPARLLASLTPPQI